MGAQKEGRWSRINLPLAIQKTPRITARELDDEMKKLGATRMQVRVALMSARDYGLIQSPGRGVFTLTEVGEDYLQSAKRHGLTEDEAREE